jgi:hypothetical protein
LYSLRKFEIEKLQPKEENKFQANQREKRRRLKQAGRALPRTSDAAGESLTALPAKAGEERAIVEAVHQRMQLPRLGKNAIQ